MVRLWCGVTPPRYRPMERPCRTVPQPPCRPHEQVQQPPPVASDPNAPLRIAVLVSRFGPACTVVRDALLPVLVVGGCVLVASCSLSFCKLTPHLLIYSPFFPVFFTALSLSVYRVSVLQLSDSGPAE
jgi:hypothetical protein